VGEAQRLVLLASAIASMPKNSTGRLATGTSCLALV
jgi:hypothetical protein